MRISIKALKKLSKEFHLDHVIIFATDGNAQHVATYGMTIVACSEAADFGNVLKDKLGWAENLHAQPSRVRKLQARIKELELQLKTLDAGQRTPENGTGVTKSTISSTVSEKSLK